MHGIGWATARGLRLGRHIKGWDRNQSFPLPEGVDDYVGKDKPVRVVDAFVDELDLAGLGFGRATPADEGPASWWSAATTSRVRSDGRCPTGHTRCSTPRSWAGPPFPPSGTAGVYLPVRAWEDTDTERAIRVRRVFVPEALERTNWLEALCVEVSSGRIELRVAGEFSPEQVGAAQRILLAGGLRGRPVIVF